MTAAAAEHGAPLAALRELGALRQWVCWRREERDGKATKVPYTPSGRRASTTDPSTWSSLEECEAAVARGDFGGIGFVFSEADPYVGIDLDHCLDADRRPNDQAERIVAKLASYTEVSPSGDGLHIIVRADLARGIARKEQGVEVYASGRYFTVTGEWWPDGPESIEERSAEVRALVERLAHPDRAHDQDDFERVCLNGADPIAQGSRHDALVKRATRLTKQGLSAAELEAALQAFNRAACDPPKDAEEVARIAAWAAEAVEAAPEPPEPSLRVLSAEEFAADVAPEDLVKGMVFEGSSHNFTGATKAGKTWLALQLAMSIERGVPFLGLETRRSPVLLLSFELSAGMVRNRMTTITEDTGTPYPAIGAGFYVVAPTAEYVPSLDLAGEKGCAELERIVGETGARVVVLDTLYRFIPGSDPSDNGEMGVVYARLNDLAQRSGAALVLLDHVAKGEQLGPVSHSGLGAQIKGGAARVVVALKRTSKEGGGRWELDVESHFGSWEEPLHYMRPIRADGSPGGGCVPCGAAEAHGLGFEAVRELFLGFAGRDASGRPFFASKRKLREALIEAKLAGGNERGDAMITAIMRDHCIPEAAASRRPDRPIVTRDGGRNATEFVWRMVEQ